MNIITFIKGVPGYVTRYEVAATNDRIDYRAGSFVMNESDEYALEEALALRKKYGGKVTLISAGPLQCQQVLYIGLAKGADRAIRVDVNFRSCEAFSIALARALQKIDYDLILTGVESSDNMATQVPISAAQMLGLPFANGVTDVEVNQDSKIIRITKEIGGGVKQLLEMPLPALLSIQSGILPLTYPAAQKVLQARARKIECLTLNDLNLSEAEVKQAEKFKIIDIFPPKMTRQAELISGEPNEAAKLLIEKIKKAS